MNMYKESMVEYEIMIRKNYIKQKKAIYDILSNESNYEYYKKMISWKGWIITISLNLLWVLFRKHKFNLRKLLLDYNQYKKIFKFSVVFYLFINPSFIIIETDPQTSEKKIVNRFTKEKLLFKEKLIKSIMYPNYDLQKDYILIMLISIFNSNFILNKYN